jgi:fimbrial chaperone protein
MTRSNLAAAALAALSLLVPSTSWGAPTDVANVDVSPVRLHLSSAHRSAMLSLRNRGAHTIRYQITADAWRESASGEMVLTPTSELVFFPSLLEIAPGETRRIRIASTAASAGVERSYRIRVEPLPDGISTRPGVVRVLTRFSVPLFVQPARLDPRPDASVRVEPGRLVAVVRNRGTSYFVARRVHVVGRARDGAAVVERELPGWYVLAGGERAYELPLSAEECAALTDVAVTVESEGAPAHASVRVDPSLCRP